MNTTRSATLFADTWVHVQIMRHLDRATHEVHVACDRGRPGHPTPTFDAVRMIPDAHVIGADLGPELSRQSGLGKLAALLRTLPAVVTFVRLFVEIRRRHIDVIHTSDRPRDAAVCVLLGRLTGRPSIIHSHVSFNMWMGRLLRWSLRRADHLISVSRFVGDSLVASGIPAQRVHVVANAVDVDAWTPERGRSQVREELAIPADAPVVLTVCRLFAEKGPAELIDAVAAVRSELPDVRLLIAGTDPGTGEFAASLRAKVTAHGLNGAVLFLGWRSDVEGLIAASDVFAMPSLEEPFGLVYLEAMTMGRPVVGLRSGGTLEVVDDGVTGLLSDPGDAAGLAANLARLLSDPEVRSRMGARGRSVVVERFTVQRMAKDVAAVYASIT